MVRAVSDAVKTCRLERVMFSHVGKDEHYVGLRNLLHSG